MYTFITFYLELTFFKSQIVVAMMDKFSLYLSRKKNLTAGLTWMFWTLWIILYNWFCNQESKEGSCCNTSAYLTWLKEKEIAYHFYLFFFLSLCFLFWRKKCFKIDALFAFDAYSSNLNRWILAYFWFCVGKWFLKQFETVAVFVCISINL